MTHLRNWTISKPPPVLTERGIGVGGWGGKGQDIEKKNAQWIVIVPRLFFKTSDQCRFTIVTYMTQSRTQRVMLFCTAKKQLSVWQKRMRKKSKDPSINMLYCFSTEGVREQRDRFLVFHIITVAIDCVCFKVKKQDGFQVDSSYIPPRRFVVEIYCIRLIV